MYRRMSYFFLKRTNDTFERRSRDPVYWRQDNIIPNSRRFTVQLCCQLGTDFHSSDVNLTFVSDDLSNALLCFEPASVVNLTFVSDDFGTLCCASNQPVCLSERSWYLRCILCVPYTVKCIKIVDRMLGLCRLNSARRLIGPTIN